MTHSLLANLGLNIVIPVFIMTRFNEAWGAVPSLLVALAFPLLYGAWDWYKERTMNFYSGLGVVSVLLTGGIGVFALPAKYLAFKEAGIPLLVGLAFLFSSFTRFDLTTKLLGQVLELKKLHIAYKKRGFPEGFSMPLTWARWLFVGSFIFSAVANYLLTIIIVTAEPATPEFTAQVGRMTALAFPVIALPIMIVFVGALYFVFWHIKKTTKKDYETYLVQQLQNTH